MDRVNFCYFSFLYMLLKEIEVHYQSDFLKLVHYIYQNYQFIFQLQISYADIQVTYSLLNLIFPRIVKRMNTSIEDQGYFVQRLQDNMQDLSENDVKQFSKTLFPVITNSNPCDSLFNALKTFYIIRMNKQVDFFEITKELLSKCEQFDSSTKDGTMHEHFSKLMSGQFFQKIKYFLFNSKEFNKNLLNNAAKENISSKQSNETKESNKESIKEDRKSNDIYIDLNKIKDQPKQKQGSAKSGSNKYDHKKNTTLGSSQTDFVSNLADKGICFCQKEVFPGQNTFTCIHCGHNYHLQCMKKKKGSKHCSMCHLRRLLPNKQTKKVLFMGILKKSKRKHEFNIHLSDEDLSMKYKLQVRCFRLKQATQFFVLFPDYTNIVINNYSLKEFNPLHRQSSLKYRKDEPFYAEIKHLIPKDNKVVIHQKMPSKESKQERIETESHLIGFFMVEQKKFEPLIKEIYVSSMTTRQESKKILQTAFKIQSFGTDDVTCQVLKIPLTCNLSTQKIKIPARGMFCNHFHCFDLYNFIMITCQTANPRWICPICKLPCYVFRVDCILVTLLQQYQVHSVTEVMFFKTGQFTVHAGDKHIKEKVSNINDLQIENAGKRPIEPAIEPERKKKKPIPQNIKIISLDLD